MIKRRWLFWLLAAALSVFFAEVISGSSAFAFFDAWGLLVILPLYGLHLLVLASFIYKRARPSWPALFLAGALFGLYEAYITKVLFLPPWDLRLPFAGVDLLAITTLVLWWHPFISFILPLGLAEYLGTSSRDVAAALPAGLRRLFGRRWLQFSLAGLLGWMQASSMPAGGGLLAGLGGLAIVGGLTWLWRRQAGAKQALADLLPSGRTQTILLSLLVFYYVWTTIFLRPEVIPGLGAQLIIWLIYAFFIWALHRALQQAAEQTRPVVTPRPIDGVRVAEVAFVYLLSSFLCGYLPPDFKTLSFAVNILFGSLIGLFVLFRAVASLGPLKESAS